MNTSQYRQSFFPKTVGQWKTTAIVVVYKGGGPSSPSNYRPISLTPILMKIFERVVREQVLLSILKEINLIHPNMVSDKVVHACLLY